MTYSNNWLDIANRALVRTGNQSIENFTGGTDNVRIINTLMPSSIESVLSLYPWKCAVTRKAIAADEAAPEFGFKYSYSLPNNFCRVVSVDVGDCEWVREGSAILTDSSFCNLIYVRLPDEPDSLSPAVRELIVLRLAYNLAETTTSNTTLMQILSQEFSAALVIAEKDEDQGEKDITDFTDWNSLR